MKQAMFLFLTIIAAAASLSAADAGAGKAFFAQRCKSCHGGDGQGNPAIAKAFKVTMRPLASKEVLSKPDDELKKAVAGGTGKMKGIAGVTEGQAADVVAFLRTMGK